MCHWTVGHHFGDITWMSWHLRSLVTHLFVQEPIQTNIRETSEFHITGSWFKRVIHLWPWIPSQRASNAERFSMSLYHHDYSHEILFPPLLCSHPHNPVWLRFWFIHTGHISVHHYGPLTFTGDYSGGMGRVRGQKGQGSCGQCSAVFLVCILYDLLLTTLIARFMGPTWGPSGANRTQLGPMLAPCTLLSGKFYPLTWKWLAEEIPWNHCLGTLLCRNLLHKGFMSS